VLWTETFGRVELEDLAATGPILLLVYLFDWSPT
jgi:hypothetical protein